MHPARRVSVRGIVFREGKLLCVRLKPYHESIKGDWWCTPGGGLDEGESLLEGVRREMIEETGIEPQIGNLLFVQQFSFNGVEQLEFLFHITNADDYLTIDLTKTSHGPAEIEEISFIDPAALPVRPTFLSSEDIAAAVAASSAKVFNNF